MKLLIGLSFAAIAIAQTIGATGGGAGPAPSRVASSAFFSGAPGGIISGAPYSAEQITENVQTLADGTRITQAAPEIMLYRDSRGRTRTERTLVLPPGAPVPAANLPDIIDIFDPVIGVHYTLDPHAHRANKLSLPTPLLSLSTGNSTAISKNGVTRLMETFSVQRSTSDTSDQARPQPSHESLGMQTIEGVVAEGTRTTVMYPVGSVGNDRPITSVSETWISPELSMVILSKNSDPRTGDTTTRLVNILRKEPDPSLFQVPSDYDIVDSQTPALKQ